MPKTLEDVKKVLEGLENDGKELYEAVTNAILQERNHGKGRVETAEANLKVVTDSLKKLGYSGEPGKIDDFVKGISDKVSKADEAFKNLGTTEQEIATLKGLVEQQNSKIETLTNESKSFETGFKAAKLKSGLMKILDGKMYSAELHADHLIDRGLAVLGKDNETVQIKKGDALVSLDVGIQEYMESHKDAVINNQSGGAGGGPTDNPGIDGNKVKSRADYDNMSPQERSDHIKDGGTFKDQ